MPFASADPALTFLAFLGASVWIGGLVTIAIVAVVARTELDPAARVAFFRSFGRRYLPVGCVALALAFAAGGALLSTRRWEGPALAAVLLAVGLVVMLTIGVAQARALTRLRARLLSDPTDGLLGDQVRRRAGYATATRATIALLSLTLLALAAVIACSRP